MKEQEVMNKRNPSLFLMAGFLRVGVIPGWDKGIILLRSIGSVALLALFVVGCGGGSGSGDSGSPPPPPPPLGGGTVSGLMGSGLVLRLLTPCPHCGHQLSIVLGEAQVNSNGPFTFDSANPLEPNLAPVHVAITQQPASPTQLCVLQTATVTHVKVVCSQFSYVT